MATIKFYSFTDDEDGSRLIFEQIESRFLDEYPLSENLLVKKCTLLIRFYKNEICFSYFLYVLIP